VRATRVALLVLGQRRNRSKLLCRQPRLRRRPTFGLLFSGGASQYLAATQMHSISGLRGWAFRHGAFHATRCVMFVPRTRRRSRASILRPVASTNSRTYALSASSEFSTANGDLVATLPHDSTVATAPWAAPTLRDEVAPPKLIDQIQGGHSLNRTTAAAKRDNCTAVCRWRGENAANADGCLFDSLVSFTPGASATIDASPVRNGQLRGIAGDSAGPSERGCIAATMRGSWKLLIAR
jgi:hypothetical protein